MGSLSQIAALKEGTLDIGIVYDAHVDDRDGDTLERVRIGTGQTMLAVHESHPFAARTSVTMAELIDEPVLGPTRKTAPGYYDRLMAACIESGNARGFVQECTTNSILLSLIAVGMGVGFVTVSGPQSPGHNIRLVPIADLGLTFDVLLVWRGRDRSAALQRFVTMMGEDHVIPPG